MLFPAIIDGYSVIEATKRSIRMGIQYFDRVFGAWISYILVILVLIVPLLVVPFTMGDFTPALMMMGIYAIPMALIVAFVLLPAVSIGLTRVYMILTAEDEDPILQEDEDEAGPNFIGGL
jgi:multidrug efflux pump subunit AcrB